MFYVSDADDFIGLFPYVKVFGFFSDFFSVFFFRTSHALHVFNPSEKLP